MIALLRYQTALLIGSHRWLPPVILYAAWLAISIRSGDPILDGFGYAASGLLPAAVWLTRTCVTNEPPAARNCAAAAAGPGRVHLACVLTAAGAALLLALVGTAVVVLLSDPRSTDQLIAVPVVPAALAGLLAALVCLLMGTAVGALSNWPVLRSTGWSIPAGLLAALLLLVLGASPANAAVSGLVTGSLHGTISTPWLPLAATALIAAAAVAAACALSSRRG
ncbi:ABC transporter [Streptomyces sp. Je 1-4]|uniref:ABC transporter n=1 Tax=Streptomyces TaxID=1883 RepID=UPI00140ED990|nr:MULTISPECIES: ABC transporter [unclassified Streptomyces]QIK06030.1 ABC transporter [Streptomyces sp. ID38640]UYB39380.1 ABC transporter [Streptomyces sp. Je 1-4]UZQ35408.1 ABC transporter [Streptomyces sp. Je 1-4] [Streptomyces sp. Je 1-4 4N24]UZQ42826.1 ABC transporter [Streptomyces sp. Je 1-4] [Streptomyces sp. Je 1-4 4N24_ara]